MRRCHARGKIPYDSFSGKGATKHGTATTYLLPTMSVGTEWQQRLVLRTDGARRRLSNALEYLLDRRLLPRLWPLLGEDAVPLVQAGFAA
jgi:hypothetical protein